MSKESALSMLTGSPVPQTILAASTPSTGSETVESNLNADPSPQSPLQSEPFNHLAKKEAALVKQRDEFKKQREVFEAERKQILEAKKQYEDYQEKKKTDPLGALKMLGFSETDVINYLANQQPPELTPEERAAQAASQAAEAKIKEFQDQQAKKEQEAQKAQDHALIQGFRGEIGNVITKNKEKYEYCDHYGPEAQDLAYEITLAVVKDSNGQDVVTAEEAVQMAEEYFEEKDQQMNNLKKRKARLQPEATVAQTQPTRTRTLSNPPAQDAPKPPVSRTRTLHNAATSTVASARHVRNETREQKRERLVQALREGAKL